MITFTAVFLSLPLVFLLWSVICFAVALLHYAFKTYQGVSLILLACIAGVIIVTTICARVFFYGIWDDPEEEKFEKSEEKSEKSEKASLPKRVLTAIRNFDEIRKHKYNVGPSDAGMPLTDIESQNTAS
jgi:hypothetical protein